MHPNSKEPIKKKSLPKTTLAKLLKPVLLKDGHRDSAFGYHS
jgi:hypothetical protein